MEGWANTPKQIFKKEMIPFFNPIKHTNTTDILTCPQNDPPEYQIYCFYIFYKKKLSTWSQLFGKCKIFSVFFLFLENFYVAIILSIYVINLCNQFIIVSIYIIDNIIISSSENFL